jgi:uncharacterized protein
LYAAIDADDPHHPAAARAIEEVAAETAVTHSYVVLETAVLVQKRLGVAAVRELHDILLEPFSIVWVDSDLHRAGLSGLLAAGSRGISFVDWVSFELMRREGITTAFAFDDDFAARGFSLVPG